MISCSSFCASCLPTNTVTLPDFIRRVFRQCALNCADGLLRIPIKVCVTNRYFFVALVIRLQFEEANDGSCFRATQTNLLRQIIATKSIESKLVNPLHGHDGCAWRAFFHQLDRHSGLGNAQVNGRTIAGSSERYCCDTRKNLIPSCRTQRPSRGA